MRYAIIGTGIISKDWVEAVNLVAGASIVACVSRSGRRPPGAPDIETAVELADIKTPFDAVIITSPNGMHHEGAIEAARLGKHVLTEKPLDITMDHMNAMIAACEAAQVTLGVGYQRRTHGHNMIIKKLISEQAFGKIFAADLNAKFWRDEAYFKSGAYRGTWAVDGGGPFMQQACHNIDIYVWFFGMPKTVVSELATFVHPIEVEDHGAALLRHHSGMIGTIVASTAAKPGLPARLEVTTERGLFVTTDDHITYWGVEGIPDPRETSPVPPAKPARHEAIVRDFETAVREKRSPLSDGYSARSTTELILAIYGMWKP